MSDIPESTQRDKEQTTEVTVETQPYSLPIEDKDLADIIDKKISDSLAYYKTTLKLDERRQLMEDFWIGKHLDESKLYEYQVPFKDNIIWQDLETRIAIAASRMPDIVVVPSNMEDDKRETAKNLEKALDIKIKSDDTKRIVKNGLRNLHLYLQSAVKCRWDKNQGENGDFIYEIVRPQRLLVDHTANIPDTGFTADNMDWIAEWIEEPLSVVVAKFPKKKDELFQKLGIIRGTQKQMVTKIKYQEIWFTWYSNEGDIYEGVTWKYDKLILDKIKNPYYDWDGYEQELDEPQTDEMGAQITTQKVYRNHFDRPRKPYIFFTHQNLGRSPVDDTSPVEQAIPLQRIVNKRGRQITEIADRAVPKLAFAGRYIDREQVRRITNDPDEHIWIQNAENITAAIMPIPAQEPSPTLYNDMLQNRQQIDSKFSTHETTRGARVAGESGISKQITREGDLMVSDDIVAMCVERVVFEMANWATQMMKVLYDQTHFVRNLGKDGDMVYLEMSQDAIDDGIIVNVKASSTDKDQRRADAVALSQQKAIDPLSLAEDLELPNPKERTRRLLAFLQSQPGDFTAYAEVIGVDIPAPVNPMGAEGGGEPTPEAQEAVVNDINQLRQGVELEVGNVTPEYLAALQQYINSPAFTQEPPEVQEAIQNWIMKIGEQVNQMAPQPEATPETPPVEEVANTV